MSPYEYLDDLPDAFDLARASAKKDNYDKYSIFVTLSAIEFMYYNNPSSALEVILNNIMLTWCEKEAILDNYSLYY